MSDSKYITFKREEWDAMTVDHRQRPSTQAEFEKWERDHQLQDSVVIRLRDEFASAALHTYANSISVAARAIGMHAPATSSRLQNIADYFHERAVESDELEHKLPD